MTRVFQLQLDFHDPVVKYVREIANGSAGRKYRTRTRKCTGDDCWTISVTGHSLGGGIATIVGSTLGIAVIRCLGFMSLSPPIRVISTMC